MTDDSDEYPPANLYDRLVATLSHHSISRETAELLSLQLAGGVSRQHSTGRTIRGQIHLGILFDAETDTAALLTHLDELSPGSTYVNGTGSSTSGLIADARSGTVDTGVLLNDEYETVFIDNAVSLSDATKESLDQILSRGSYTTSKSGIHETCHTSSSIVLVDTLQYGSRDEIMSIDEELDYLLPPSTKNRLDVASIDSGEDYEPDTTPLDPEKIRSGLERARSLDPELKPGTSEYLEKKVDERLNIEHTKISTETVGRFAEACARLDYNGTVTSHHVNIVVRMCRKILTSMHGSPEKQTGNFDAEIVSTGNPQKQQDPIRSVEELIVRMEEQYEKGVPVKEIADRAEEVGLGSEKAKKEIENMLMKGELYFPIEDHVRTT